MTRTMERTTRATLAMLLALTLAILPLTATRAQAQNNQPNAAAITIPITGTGPGGTFSGTFQLQRFVASQGQVFASGLLTGTLTNTVTGVVTSVVQNILLPVTVGQTSCQILHLDLGPLHLDLLGLQIDLSRIVLDVTAQAGAGNLLGNLLCAVANLLNNPSQLAQLLNQILALL